MPLRKKKFDVGERVMTNHTTPHPTARELRRSGLRTPRRHAARASARIPRTRTTPVRFTELQPNAMGMTAGP